MTSVRFDASQIAVVLDAINRASRVAVPDARKVVTVGANNVKRDWRRRWSGHPHLRPIVRTIDYDLFDSLRGPAAEIGPNRERGPGAALANIPEYGTLNNAPIPGGAPAAAAEEPRMVKALEDLAVKALGLD